MLPIPHMSRAISWNFGKLRNMIAGAPLPYATPPNNGSDLTLTLPNDCLKMIIDLFFSDQSLKPLRLRLVSKRWKRVVDQIFPEDAKKIYLTVRPLLCYQINGSRSKITIDGKWGTNLVLRNNHEIPNPDFTISIVYKQTNRFHIHRNLASIGSGAIQYASHLSCIGRPGLSRQNEGILLILAQILIEKLSKEKSKCQKEWKNLNGPEHKFTEC